LVETVGCEKSLQAASDFLVFAFYVRLDELAIGEFGVQSPATSTKKKSRASGFFFLYSSLFSFHSSLFSKSPARLFQRRDKREERKEKVAFLPLVEKP
jgi:hypothetical protein